MSNDIPWTVRLVQRPIIGQRLPFALVTAEAVRRGRASCDAEDLPGYDFATGFLRLRAKRRYFLVSRSRVRSLLRVAALLEGRDAAVAQGIASAHGFLLGFFGLPCTREVESLPPREAPVGASSP